jgi:hypothetical protein
MSLSCVCKVDDDDEDTEQISETMPESVNADVENDVVIGPEDECKVGVLGDADPKLSLE